MLKVPLNNYDEFCYLFNYIVTSMLNDRVENNELLGLLSV